MAGPHVLRLIGYWLEPGAAPDGSRGWPNPHDLIGDWNADDRQAVLSHLRRGKAFGVFSGRSSCRLCGQDLGSAELTDGVWAWPDGSTTHAIAVRTTPTGGQSMCQADSRKSGAVQDRLAPH